MKNVDELDFSKLPTSISDAQIEGKIMAIDNIGRAIDSNKRAMAESYCYPTKTDLIIIVFCLKGSAHFHVNLKDVSLEPMHLMVMLSGFIFEVEQVSEDFEGVIILNNPDGMALNDEAIVSVSLRRIMAENGTVLVTDQQFEKLMVMYNLFKQALQDTENPFRNQIVQRLCQVITYYACGVFQESPIAKIDRVKSRKEEIFDKFILLVEQEYTHERRIIYYADKLNLSPKYLSTVVKEASGKYASDWIDDYVVLEAKALLKKGGLNIQQISDRLNFPNQSFFGRYFKKQTGYSPKDYRNL